MFFICMTVRETETKRKADEIHKSSIKQALAVGKC